MTVAGILPGVIVTLHDMAVRTICRIAGQIAPAFAVSERERTQSREDAQQDNEDDGEREDQLALCLAEPRGCSR